LPIASHGSSRTLATAGTGGSTASDVAAMPFGLLQHGPPERAAGRIPATMPLQRTRNNSRQ